MPRIELHRSGRAGWLRAAVLGADDGIVSTASLMIGVAAAAGSRSAILVAGMAGLAAGAMSMAVGEYVSVSSQRDAERADVLVEKQEHATAPQTELEELRQIYVGRGLGNELALTVAKELTAGDPLATHLRDELGFSEGSMARPVQAGIVSAVSFALGAAFPILSLLVAPSRLRVPAIVLVALLLLATLGATGGHLGGAPRIRAAMRVTIGGGIAMALTALIGRLVHVAGL
ncbi:MAG: VIT1/CCC1 transporter family protein [Actinomycetota bacterium]